MDSETARVLCGINNGFYAKHGLSFSQTRKAPWHGWERCLDMVKAGSPESRRELSVFDLACGNLRFEAFLKAALPDTAFSFYAVDNCDALLPEAPTVDYQSLDVLDLLQDGSALGSLLDAPACDLSVSFGFMHHIPLGDWRQEVLAALVGKAKPGGYAIVSFWQFMKNEAMARKAATTHRQAMEDLGLPELEGGDFLLGWKGIPGQYRYCHSFSEEEIDRLAASVAGKAPVVARFAADGRTDNLNTYLILGVL